MAQAYVYDDSAAGWRLLANADLPASGAAAGTYGDATHVAQVSVNAQGIVTNVSSVAIAAGSGTVSLITSTGGTITVTNGAGPTANVDLPASGVAAASYGDSSHVAQITVDAQGRITAASAVAISGSVAGTKHAPLPFGAPDASGNAFAQLVATANIRLLVPAFTNGVDGVWWAILHVPSDYSSTPAIVLRVAANSAAGQVSRWIVSSKAIGTGGTWDAALTAETAQNLTMSTTAYRPADVTFTLSTTPVAGSDLIVAVQRNGANAADTLVVAALLFDAYFTYA